MADHCCDDGMVIDDHVMPSKLVAAAVVAEFAPPAMATNLAVTAVPLLVNLVIAPPGEVTAATVTVMLLAGLVPPRDDPRMVKVFPTVYNTPPAATVTE